MPRKYTPVSYFRVNPYNWLEYKPWKNHELPDLVHVTDPREDVEYMTGNICRPNTSEVIQSGPLYRLAWPGETDRDMEIPYEIVKRWVTFPKNYGKAPVMLRELQANDLLPKDGIPPCITYHLAVNRPHYENPYKGSHNHATIYPVAGLPPKRVDQVLDAEFVLDASALAGLKYLKWVAETHWGHPLLSDFDTAVRDELLGLAIKATLLFFRLLGDYQYNRKTRYWEMSEDKYWWANMAAYLFWVGRTGGALYADHAGFPSSNEHRVERFLKDLPDVDVELRTWKVAGARARDNAHTRGDPAQVKIPEVETPVTVGSVYDKAATQYIEDHLGDAIKQAILGGHPKVVVYEGDDAEMAWSIVRMLKKASYTVDYQIDKDFGTGKFNCHVGLTLAPSSKV